MADKVMPEERLLNIIRAGKKHSSVRNAPTVSPLEAKLRGLVSSRMLPRWILGAAIAAVATGVLYLISAVVLPVERSVATLPRTQPQDQGVGSANERVNREQPLTFYLDGIRNRNIFEMKAVRAQEAATVPVDLFKDLSLLGVIAEDPPQAIVKDKRSGNTHFLYTGDKIGDMIVQSISEGKVVVEHKGELYEMHL